jgi:adenosylmethionine-8-amino-7-oxononanoate aminotransferase
VDDVAFDGGLITYSTMPTRDGFAGDQTLFAPPFTTTDDELAEMVERFANAVRQVATELEAKLEARPA